MNQNFLLFLTFVLLLNNSIASKSFNDNLCDIQLDYFRTSLLNQPRERWAMEMFDYWAKIQSGLSAGQSQNFGHFDECIDFTHTSSSSSVGTIQGQHCMIFHTATEEQNKTNWNPNFDWREIGKIVRNKQMKLATGICVPASCNTKKVIDFANNFLSSADLIATDATCKTNDQLPFDWLDIFTIVFFSIIIFIIAASTVYEIYMNKKDQQPHKLLIAFSLWTNTSKFFDMTRSKSKSSINCMNGIRAISTLWIILGHRKIFHTFFPLTNTNAFIAWHDNIRSVIYQPHSPAVDSFFVMGGLLVTWTFLGDLEKKKVSLWRMFLRRYMRYTPVLGILVLFTASLYRHLTFGPSEDPSGNISNCEGNWFWPFTHIQNYVVWNICLAHSWYLSVDFQLFILSPLLIYPAWKFGWKFLWLFFVLIIAVIVYTFLIAFSFEVAAYHLRLEQISTIAYYLFIYFPTHARMNPWLIGMLTGYFLYKNRDTKLKISGIWMFILWIISLCTIASVVIGFHPFMRLNNNTTTVFANAFYLATFRTAFACGVAWIIFACQNKSGSFIRWFLSLPQWQPLARMGLSVYLVHPIYQSIIIFNQRQVVHFSEVSMFLAFTSDVMISFFLGAFLYLFIEFPFSSISDYLLK
ncbi:hypothetical protein PVAND_000972 [Polypedilum vanderplanki]|uniref:Nose resistant-to-fluoxetine protein N-terminal domain-containing protein n=1 Tax=Polypedilum vanderplanki TaxID=319348 RepID=A0A9J6BLX7_POLVA|nr:hypothetical protein PVAND_000972 [Polypedilum vanderplanki]